MFVLITLILADREEKIEIIREADSTADALRIVANDYWSRGITSIDSKRVSLDSNTVMKIHRHAVMQNLSDQTNEYDRLSECVVTDDIYSPIADLENVIMKDLPAKINNLRKSIERRKMNSVDRRVSQNNQPSVKDALNDNESDKTLLAQRTILTSETHRVFSADDKPVKDYIVSVISKTLTADIVIVCIYIVPDELDVKSRYIVFKERVSLKKSLSFKNLPPMSVGDNLYIQISNESELDSIPPNITILPKLTVALYTL